MDSPFETPEAQMVEIRKALIAAQEQEDQQLCQRWKESRDDHHPQSTPTTLNDTSTVLYHPNGGTPLFKSIEEQNWEKASDILQNHPEQAKIWVVSTGTLQTTFDWSLWKRLPLHEAARRQPPRGFVLDLFRANPDSIRETTQFGELALHLAVECGASPDVVYLFMLLDWNLCNTGVDQSGRTALDILKDANVLDPNDQADLMDAITATMETYHRMEQAHENQMENLRQKHQVELEQLRYVCVLIFCMLLFHVSHTNVQTRLEHQQELSRAKAKQSKLSEKVHSLQTTIKQRGETISQQKNAIQEYSDLEHTWNQRYEVLTQQSHELRTELSAEQSSTDALVQTIAGRDEQIAHLKEQIVDLQTAVSRMAGWHNSIVQPQLSALQNALSSVNDSYETLQDHLLNHSEDLSIVMKEFDGNITASTVEESHVEEEEESEEEPINDDEAMSRAAQAASHVL